MDDERTIKINPAGKPGADLKVGGRTLVGGILGADYRLEQLLGRGGCGSVYLAHDLPLDRKVAVKIVGVGQAMAVSREAIQRFMREARAIASVEHPNIVPVYRVGQDQELAFIVMQYIKGETLTQRMQAETGMSLADILLVAVQIAAALAAAHGHGLVHRDIKPSNVMIDDHGYVKVMDFGLARTIGPDTAITHTGMFVGTPRYSSPEQCETTSIDCRSDLYSLGVIIYEMLAGTVPHEAETPLQLMHKIVHEPPPPLEQRNATVPADVRAIVARLLAKKPEQRYASATELLVDLRSVIARLQTSETETFHPTIQLPADPQSALTSSRIRRRRRQWLKIAAAAVLTLAVAGLAVHFRRVMAPTSTAASATAAPKLHQGKLNLAIYDFENATRDPQLNWLEIGMPDMLAANLSQHGFISVKTREEVLWSVNPRPERFDDRLRQQLQPLAVEFVARGAVYREGNQLRFVVKLLSLDSARQIGMMEQKGTVDGVFKAIDGLADQLLQLLHQTAMKGTGMPTPVASLSTRELVFAQRFATVEKVGGDKSRGDAAMGRRMALRKDAARPELDLENRARAAGYGQGADADAKPQAAAAPARPPEPVQALKRAREEGDGALPRTMEKKELSEAGPVAGPAGEKGKADLQAGNPAPAARMNERLAQSGETMRKEAEAEVLEQDEAFGTDAFAPRQLEVLRMKYFYQGNQCLQALTVTHDTMAAQQKKLCEAILAAGADAAALQRAYDNWQKELPTASPDLTTP